jgi:hypothetical protein
VISRLGLKHCFLIVALAFSPAFVAGCASAPIDMRASDDSELNAVQVQLRDQANGLADRLELQGWTLSSTPAEATRSFLGRLIGGADTVEEAGSDSVALYLAQSDAERAQQDLAGLVAETQALADQTLVVASVDGVISSSALARDLAAVERALGAVRRAKAFFTEVSQQAGWQDALTLDLYNIVAAERRLATAADALAERRWATRSGLFG